MPVKEREKEDQAKELTLPDLMGNITRRLLTALETGDTSTKQSEMNGCRQDLRLWYEALPAEKRKAMAQDLKRIMQNFKGIGEQFYSDLVSLTAQDL